MGAKANANTPPPGEAMNEVVRLISVRRRGNLEPLKSMRDAYPRYAKFILVSNVNVLDRHLKVVHDFGDQRSYETLGLLGVLYSIRRYMRSPEWGQDVEQIAEMMAFRALVTCE